MGTKQWILLLAVLGVTLGLCAMATLSESQYREHWPFVLTAFAAVVLAVLLGLKVGPPLLGKGYAIASLREAMDAIEQGDSSTAIRLLNKAIWILRKRMPLLKDIRSKLREGSTVPPEWVAEVRRMSDQMLPQAIRSTNLAFTILIGTFILTVIIRIIIRLVRMGK